MRNFVFNDNIFYVYFMKKSYSELIIRETKFSNIILIFISFEYHLILTEFDTFWNRVVLVNYIDIYSDIALLRSKKDSHFLSLYGILDLR